MQLLLLQVMSDEFRTVVEDGSAGAVVEYIKRKSEKGHLVVNLGSFQRSLEGKCLMLRNR